ncbi:PE domain-containing protein [Mycobacterium riyadhense]|uniref:PE domain-containing protein n=1 Tax=Mycobacterium riyadhense TaxID=486698 RepID=UPI001EF9CCB5|nr:PE domain-containing protein [Mycobacterium riyadhense]
MSFQPVVADIGEQVVNIGTNALEQAAKASMSMTGLAPAGADEVSAQAAMAFHEEAAALLALNQAAQQELMRTGSAFTQIAQTYTEIDEAAAEALVFSAHPPRSRS